MLVAVDLTPEKLASIESEVDVQARALSRVEIVKQSVAKSLIVKVSTIDEAFKFSNDYAPEHLILHIDNASAHVGLINNAGSVFVGPFTPERYVLRLYYRDAFPIFVLVAVIMHRERITLYLQMATHVSTAV